VYEDRKIESEKVEFLKETLLWSSSSKNINPGELMFVDDKEFLKNYHSQRTWGETGIFRRCCNWDCRLRWQKEMKTAGF
jgi:hypothetical protein